MDLKTARAKAREALSSVDQGNDPAEAKKASRAALRARAKPPASETTEAAIDAFITRHAKVRNRESVWRQADQVLRRELAPWMARRLDEIRPADVHAILDAKIEAGAPIGANRCLAVLRRFFCFAVERQIIPVSPCASIGAPAPTRSRDSVLDAQEISAVWRAAGNMAHPFGPLTRLLILTGQRRGEVAAIEWSEVDFDGGVWRIPGEKTKNHRAHIVHLAPAAVALIRTADERGRVGRFVFGLDTPPTGFSKAKRRLDSLVGDAVMAAWTVHDIRRSVATGLARSGVEIAVIERLLNHVSGTFGGIVGTYQRHDFTAERRAALESWARTFA